MTTEKSNMLLSLTELRSVAGKSLSEVSRACGYETANAAAKTERSFPYVQMSTLFRYMHGVGVNKIDIVYEVEGKDEIIEYITSPEIKPTGVDFMFKDFFLMCGLSTTDIGKLMECTAPVVSAFFYGENPYIDTIGKYTKKCLGGKTFIRFFLEGKTYDLEVKLK